MSESENDAQDKHDSPIKKFFCLEVMICFLSCLSFLEVGVIKCHFDYFVKDNLGDISGYYLHKCGEKYLKTLPIRTFVRQNDPC